MVRYLEKLNSYSDFTFFELFDGDRKSSFTYADYLSDMKKCAYLLEEKVGPVKGKHLGIIANADYEYLVLMGAIIFSRAVAVPFNNNEIKENILGAISTAEVDVVIAADEYESYCADTTDVISKEKLFETISDSKDEIILNDFSNEEAKDLALILFTSGTTGLSKGVSLSVESLFAKERGGIFRTFLNGQENGKDITVYTNFPLYHMAGIFLWLTSPLFGTILAMSKDPKRVLVDLENNNIDFAVVIPAMVKLWGNYVKRGRKERLGNVKFIISGGASVDTELIKLFTSEGILFTQFYGLTETGSAVTANFYKENITDSIGKAIDGAEIFCKDGEICVKTWSNMAGYYNNLEETEECMQDGVIYTGDLGYVDEDGYIYITGRKKNLIILSGGENVSPEEIESKVYENPVVKECKVFEKNDRVAIEIYAPEQDEKSIREYITNLNQDMPAYKKIYFVDFRNTEFEKTASGKIKR